ncbi:MAG: PfkB family carbohydrate kinase [Methylophaga sp.]|nr:PfkB family carbohydrate kinase [Methylophaga sp.]
MARILTVGIATLDIINQVTAYPDEDSELRALSQQQRRGGNASNTAVVLSQLGHQVDFAGVLINEPDLALITADLDAYQVNYQYCPQLNTGKMPTSYITVSTKTGSRTIVHFRDCPELSFADFQRIDLSVYDWLHFEGRNINETQQMLTYAALQQPLLPRSVELEKPRDGIEQLLKNASVVMASQPYAEAAGYHSADAFLSDLAFNQATCSWGADGIWGKFASQLRHHPATRLDQVIETLGAGDTLNAGLIHGLLQNWPIEQVLTFASQLAGLKCQQQGFANLNHIFKITDYD